MKLESKTIYFIGSSVTLGAAANNISFADIIADEYGANIIKDAISSTPLADVNDNSYISRLKNADKSLKIDLFICQLSTNDAYYSLPIELTEKAIRDIIETVDSTYHCTIIFFTGTKYDNAHYEKMVNLLYTLSNELDFYILDLYNDPEMQNINEEDYIKYMHDPVHPNYIGYKEWWTPKFVEFIKKI